MALDVGERRIGVALSDPEGILASPMTVIQADEPEAFDTISDLVVQHNVERLVVGIPRSLDGSIGPQAQVTYDFVARLRSRVGVPLDTWDERFSTVAADRAMAEAGTRSKKRKKIRDAVAAAVVLQSYLDRMRTQDR